MMNHSIGKILVRVNLHLQLPTLMVVQQIYLKKYVLNSTKQCCEMYLYYSQTN